MMYKSRRRGLAWPRLSLVQNMDQPIIKPMVSPDDDGPIILTAMFFDHATENGGTADADNGDYTLGVHFRADQSGKINKAYFWKPAANVQTGRSFGIWDAETDALLWSGSTTGEAAGPAWIECVVDPPLELDQFQSVIIGATTNKYSASPAYFSTEIRRDPLVAPVYDGNGLFNSGEALTRPTSTFNGANYWLDLEYEYTVAPDYTWQGTPDPIAIPSGYPTADNTGWSGELTPASFVRSTADDQIIENLDIFGNVFIEHDNVTIRNCRIVSGVPFHVIQLDIGAHPTYTMTVEDCEIDGRNVTINGILGAGTFRRNNIHGVHNGINSGDATITDNYIHALGGQVADDPHFDCIECNSAPNGMTITHNTLFCVHSQTSAIMLNNEFGAIRDVLVDDNIAAGGAYTIYVDDTKGGGTVEGHTIRLTNNKMLTGQFGYFSTYTSDPIVMGNTDAITGLPVGAV